MKHRKNRRQKRKANQDINPDSPLSLVGQLLWQSLRGEKQKWYGLLIILPRFYLTLRFNRCAKQIVEEGLNRVAAARSLGEAEAKAAVQKFQNELMVFLVEKKLVKPE